MKFHAVQLLPLLSSVAVAQRPNSTSICDYYSNALLKSVNGTSQYTLLTLLVNTAVIGNWTSNTFNVKVNGILAPGTFNGAAINLLPYFDGTLKSTNKSGVASSVVFLDDGGAAPLKDGKPANGDSSNQYRLLTHLYQYFGALLGCTSYAQMGFPAYEGRNSQANVHGFMNLGPNQVGYFIQQVGLAAASFGVAQADIQVVANALTTTFNYRCAPPVTVIPQTPMALQAICLAESCQLSPDPTCALYAAAVQPQFQNGTNFTTPTGMVSGSGSASGTARPTATAGSGAVAMSLPVLSGLGSIVVGFLGFLAL